MNGCTLFTAWQETDDWGRTLVWSWRKDGYYCKKLPWPGSPETETEFKPVGQVQFALALLRAHEKRAGQ
jgi:hypothetical protein